MRNVPACFFCSTPFQIMAAICLIKGRKINADIYVQNIFKQANEVADRLRKENIFANVVFVHDAEIKEKYLSSKNNIELRIKLATTYLHVKEIAEGILIPDTHYDEMYLSYRAYVPRLVYFYFIKKKENTRLVFFDDGTGSYDMDMRFAPKASDRMVRRLLFGKKSCEDFKTKYLFSPEIYFRLHPQSVDEDVVKLPCIWEDEENVKLLERIFSLSQDTRISEPIIFINTFPVDKPVQQIVASVMELLAARFGQDNIIIKKHPRDFGANEKGYKYYQYNGIPFEALCTQMDMNKKVMVAIKSTAAIMPKLLLNKEPYVIMLYKLIEEASENPLSDALYEACAEEYSHADRFFMPTTFDELKRIISEIKIDGSENAQPLQ